MAEAGSRAKKQAHESDRTKSNITVGKQIVQQNRDTNSNLIKNNPSNEMVAS